MTLKPPVWFVHPDHHAVALLVQPTRQPPPVKVHAARNLGQRKTLSF